MAKRVVISDLTTPSVIMDVQRDFVEFLPNFVLLLTEATDRREYISWAYSSNKIHKVTISPETMAYAGDAVPGTGSKKVTIDFAGLIPTVVMTLVDNVDVSNGWAVITKDEDVIGYSPFLPFRVIVEPS